MLRDSRPLTDPAPGRREPDGGGCGRVGAASRAFYRNELISIVSSRPGPTPIAEIGAPDMSSRALT